MPDAPANDNRAISSASELLASAPWPDSTPARERTLDALTLEFYHLGMMIDPGIQTILESLNVPRETRMEVMKFTSEVTKTLDALERSVTGMFHQMEAQRCRDGSR